jgi:hypothetical protein
MPSRIVRVNPNTLHRELQGEGVLLQLDSGEYFGLDEIGQRMWALLVEHRDLSVVASRLADEFDAEPEVLTRDLNELVDELVSRRLLDL